MDVSSGRRSPLIGPDGSVVVISGSLAPSSCCFSMPQPVGCNGACLCRNCRQRISPFSTDGDIFYGTGRNIVSLDADGLERWRFDTGDSLTGCTRRWRRTAPFTSEPVRVHALDAQGNVKWTFTPVDALGDRNAASLCRRRYPAGSNVRRRSSVDGCRNVEMATYRQRRPWHRGGQPWRVVLRRHRRLTAVGPLGGLRWRSSSPAALQHDLRAGRLDRTELCSPLATVFAYALRAVRRVGLSQDRSERSDLENCRLRYDTAG